MTMPAEALPDNPTLAAEMRPALVKFFKRKTGDVAEAEDLAQDVLVKALSHAVWKSPEEAKGYIFRTAVNRWYDRLRRKRTRGVNVVWDEGIENEIEAEIAPERVLIAREELHLIAQAIELLSERTRTVLMLTKFEHMKAANIGQALGISESTVNKHLASALAQLTAAVKRGGNP
jgi:RNA polymerase sigma-70 factor (ECF subfamily)